MSSSSHLGLYYYGVVAAAEMTTPTTPPPSHNHLVGWRGGEAAASPMEEEGLTIVTEEEDDDEPQEASRRSSTTTNTTTSTTTTSREGLLQDTTQDDNDDEDADDEEEEEDNLGIERVEDEESQEEEEDDEDETSILSTATTTTPQEEQEQIQAQATTLRLQGKQAHDDGDYEVAADYFGEAAERLLRLAGGQEQQDEEQSSLYATCRLHQALCYLKLQDYEACQTTCTQLLLGGSEKTTTPTISPLSSAIRARAHHRRAKAYVGLGMEAEALEDARAAAFLGDPKAVQLYGRLMRKNSNDSIGGGSSSSSSDLLASLLSKSTSATGDSPLSSSSSLSSMFNPASLLMGNGSGSSSLMESFLGGNGGDNSGGSLAASVLKSMTKRLDDPQTHIAVANFLQAHTATHQLQQYATLAGLDIPTPYLEGLSKVCRATASPTKLKWMVRLTKSGIYMTKLMRKIGQLLTKYKSLLVLTALLQWSKSAMARPIPIDRVAAKQELKKAMKAQKQPKRKG